MIRRLLDFFWANLFKIPAFRHRISFQVGYRCLSELNLSLPLGHGVYLPWFDQEVGSSFLEVFLEQEYAGLFRFMAPPTRWVDLGAYAGFFSAWILWNRNRMKIQGSAPEALLVDADDRSTPLVDALLRVNNLTGKFLFRHGAIADGTGSCSFVRRSYMGSGLASTGGLSGQAFEVPILTTAEIIGTFPPPYDLVKVDIEGAEYELLRNHRKFLAQCEYLVMEWHSWHSGGGGLAQLQDLAAAARFNQLAELQPARNVPLGQTGTLLFRRSESRVGDEEQW
jgi:FkbM family methyltransferase